ncbi:hypothetical protein ACOMHN_011551 [Nucella lapillus]
MKAFSIKPRHIEAHMKLWTGASGLRWSEELRVDSGTIQVCSGQSIQLFWNYTLEKGERVKGIVWGCQPEGEKEDVLATFVDDHFVPTSSFSGRLAHLHDGGIELSCATILESGNYSIAVRTKDRDNYLTVHRKTVSVKVVDTPKTQSGEIQVTREAEAMRDVISGEWHVQLSCGNFSDLGHPPVQVIWTTPQGERVESSSYDGNGFFRLLLPNPVQGGNYTCSIAPFQPAAQCLPRDSPLLDTHRMVEVQETAGRFSLLEARQQELMDKMAAERCHCTSLVETMANMTSLLEQRLEVALQRSVSVSFHARLTADTQLSDGAILKLNQVISNQGGGYDPDTGYFTAPLNGTYFFIGTTGPYSNDNHEISIFQEYANMRLMKERTDISQTHRYRGVGSCHGAVYLTAGDKVWLQSLGMGYFNPAATFFSGFRI